MPTRDGFMSSAELIAAYVRQRVNPRVFVPLAMLLAGAGWLLVPPTGVDIRDLAFAAFRALVLVVMFRVWDDLEDRPFDLDRHPDRVMVNTMRFAPFAVLMASLAIVGVGSVALLRDAPSRILALAIAAGTACVWYGARPIDHRHPVVGSHIVLVKYPLIAYAAAPSLPSSPLHTRPLLVLLALYVLICIYEYADDRELRHAAFVLFSGSLQP
jgi:hypothetical protein